MIKFAYPEILYALALIPVMLAGYWLFSRARARARKRFGEEAILELLAEEASRAKRRVKFILFTTGKSVV